MRHRIGFSMVVGVAALSAAAPASAQFTKGPSSPKGKVNLVSSVDAIVPGQPFDIALHFQLIRGWHIYWQNSGDSGQPPRVTWSLPDGFAVGHLQYPVPKRHVAGGAIVTNVLEGEPVLPVRVTPPEMIEEQKVALKAKVRYLICKEICLIESADLRLELLVLPPGSEAKAANEALFRRARRALPKQSSKYLSVTAMTKPEELAPGKRFDLLVNIDIKRGYHIQSHEPLNPNFIKCEVFLERVNGVSFKDRIYPAPKFRTLKVVGKVSEYDGKITVRVPGEIDAEASPGPFALGGVFKYQACDEKGTCFPPEAVAFSLKPAASMYLSPSRPPSADKGAASAAAGATVDPLAGDAAPVESPIESPTAKAMGHPSSLSSEQPSGFLDRLGTVGLLVGCFLYGLFLNATPCVLPLLSIKVLGFVQQAHESRRRTLVLGLAFGAGVMLFFVVLGFLASAGKNVLQYPAAVIALAAVVMALALSMLGVYTLQAPTAATKLEASIQKEGLISSFGKGALAPVLGFACTAPLLAGAFGWATQQQPHIAVFAFLFAGLGMASPYMLLGANPNWLSFLPKPGQWMITFERIMGFLLLAMVIWLLHPLVTHIGAEGLEWTLGFLVAIGMACWVLGKIDMTMSAMTRWRYRGGATAIVLTAGVLVYGWIYPLDEARARVQSARLASRPNGDDWSSGVPWQPWSPAAVDNVVRSGRIVFVDFTAAYCTVCKQNKGLAVNTSEVRDKMQALGVVPFQGDFTSGDEQIFEVLQKHSRAGVPLDLIYPAGKPDAPIVLRPNLTKRYLLQKLNEAATARASSVPRLGS